MYDDGYYMLSAVQVAAANEGSYGAGTLSGGINQGTLLKSKKSITSGCAASRAVSVCPFRNRVSTSLIIAVWSMGM